MVPLALHLVAEMINQNTTIEKRILLLHLSHLLLMQILEDISMQI